MLEKSLYNFELPEALIAKFPATMRTESRLLHVKRDASGLVDRKFTDVLDLINQGDLLVCNNTKVIKARLFGEKASGGKVEIMVERILNHDTVLAHSRSNKTVKVGQRVTVADDAIFELLERDGQFFIYKIVSELSLIDALDKYGHMPLPHYMNRSDSEFDETRYQTVYAQKDGAVAAPTAGLHFDQDIMQALQDKGVEIGYVTLHVGSGTFQPVKVENILEHKMHSEYYEVDSKLIEQIQRTKANGKRVVAVGTTSLRSLESLTTYFKSIDTIQPYQGDTDIFIYPGYTFKCVDALITNFHLPESTLIMLVSAFAGHQNVMSAYEHAIAQQYRFYSYGDAMFLD